MKFIQITFQSYPLDINDTYAHTVTINVSQILKITSSLGCGYDHCNIIMLNGEDIKIDRKVYDALMDLIQEEWEGVRAIPY